MSASRHGKKDDASRHGKKDDVHRESINACGLVGKKPGTRDQGVSKTQGVETVL